MTGDVVEPRKFLIYNMTDLLEITIPLELESRYSSRFIEILYTHV